MQTRAGYLIAALAALSLGGCAAGTSASRAPEAPTHAAFLDEDDDSMVGEINDTGAAEQPAESGDTGGNDAGDAGGGDDAGDDAVDTYFPADDDIDIEFDLDDGDLDDGE